MGAFKKPALSWRLRLVVIFPVTEQLTSLQPEGMVARHLGQWRLLTGSTVGSVKRVIHAHSGGRHASRLPGVQRKYGLTA